MSERKLQAWVGAGLIDGDAASRIREWETQNRRPLALWAIVGLAVLTIGLGLVSLIAANWEAIPGTARLAIHFVCIIGLALYLFFSKQHAEHQALINDGALFILGALGLTFFGHIGQVYQSNAPIWQALGLWLLLFSPVLLLFGRGWPVAGMWLAGFLATVDTYAMDKMEAAPQYAPTFHLNLILALPIAVTGFAAFFRVRSTRPSFWRNLEMLSFLITIIGTGGMLLIGSLSDVLGGGSNKAIDEARIAQALVAVVTALLVWLFHKGRSGNAVTGILASSALLNIAATITGSSVILGALLFILFGVSIAVASLYAEWRGAFQGAVVVIALRLIILSFQLADDLLGSGVGLILAGFLTLAIAYAAVRISRNYAPEKEITA